jgi:hypothetical protein
VTRATTTCGLVLLLAPHCDGTRFAARRGLLSRGAKRANRHQQALRATVRLKGALMTALILLALLAASGGAAVQQTAADAPLIVSGLVLHNPAMNDCRRESCASDLVLTRDEDWVPPPGAVNVVVRGTRIVAKTDRMGRYRIEVPSPDAEIVFHWVGYERTIVPVGGRPRIDVRLTPTPLPLIERLLALIVPQLEIGIYPNLDDLATEARTDRETARDFVWLVIGNRTMMREYPGDFFPDYRFETGSDGKRGDER